ncbi:MAG TPA: restriction endonuclease [Pyrinomonadaceae bacterium]|jgi:hypothetical protein|nr:restriction endonuclease [Pyrinomonadaceae bacterium]
MTKRVSAISIQALKEALCSIYWYKKDLRSFLNNCVSDRGIISRTDWQAYKRQIVSDIVDYLCANQDKYFDDIQRLFHEIAKMESFRHLEELEDGKQKAEKAKKAVADLRRLVLTHDEVVDEEKLVLERRSKAAERIQNSQAISEHLNDIRSRYMSLVTSTETNKRGFDLEKILYDLFELFDLDPKASFRNRGEQIDGAFTLEGTDYLFEAKWQKSPADIQDLDAFSGKVQRKLDNTLGLFLSINDFSPDAVAAHSTSRRVTILMTGADLMAVLEGRIDFVTLLQRKRRHASQTGNILLRIYEMTD